MTRPALKLVASQSAGSLASHRWDAFASAWAGFVLFPCLPTWLALLDTWSVVMADARASRGT